jgi:hypothetical protein
MVLNDTLLFMLIAILHGAFNTTSSAHCLLQVLSGRMFLDG